MDTATLSEKTVAKSNLVKNNLRRRFKNVNAFLTWAFEQEDSYEFANGKVFKKEMIKDDELTILWWLDEIFESTNAFKKKSKLRSEVGVRLANDNFRIPDLAFFTAEQHFAAAKGQHPIPELAIEILSKSESAQHIADKIRDYFQAGVKVVWYIYPKIEQIYVYTSPKDIRVLEGEDICSAAPIVSDFEFPAQMIFKTER